MTGGFLKSIDVFKAPVEMFIHRHNKKENKKEYTPKMGSQCGGLLAILAILLLGAFTF